MTRRQCRPCPQGGNIPTGILLDAARKRVFPVPGGRRCCPAPAAGGMREKAACSQV